MNFSADRAKVRYSNNVHSCRSQMFECSLKSVKRACASRRKSQSYCSCGIVIIWVEFDRSMARNQPTFENGRRIRQGLKRAAEMRPAHKNLINDYSSNRSVFPKFSDLEARNIRIEIGFIPGFTGCNQTETGGIILPSLPNVHRPTHSKVNCLCIASLIANPNFAITFSDIIFCDL